MKSNGLAKERLTKNVANPHLIFEIDKQQRICFDGKQRVSSHQPPEDVSSIKLAEMTI